MQFGRIFDILGAIVAVAGVTVVVTSPQLSGDLAAFGGAFSSSLKAAMGH